MIARLLLRLATLAIIGLGLGFIGLRGCQAEAAAGASAPGRHPIETAEFQRFSPGAAPSFQRGGAAQLRYRDRARPFLAARGAICEDGAARPRSAAAAAAPAEPARRRAAAQAGAAAQDDSCLFRSLT